VEYNTLLTTCTSPTISREARRFGHVQLLIDDRIPGLRSSRQRARKLHGHRQPEGAVRYKKNGCRTTTRPSDRTGTDDDRRALRDDAGRQNDADGWGRRSDRFRTTWRFETMWRFRLTRSPHDLAVNTTAKPLE